MISDQPTIIMSNVGGSNEVALAIGSGSDARIHQLDSSGNTIFKLPATDGQPGQKLLTNGSGDLKWFGGVLKHNGGSAVSGAITLDFGTYDFHYIDFNGSGSVKGSNWMPGGKYSIAAENTTAGNITIDLKEDGNNTIKSVTVPAGQVLWLVATSFSTTSAGVIFDDTIVTPTAYWSM